MPDDFTDFELQDQIAKAVVEANVMVVKNFVREGSKPRIIYVILIHTWDDENVLGVGKHSTCLWKWKKTLKRLTLNSKDFSVEEIEKLFHYFSELVWPPITPTQSLG